MGFLAQIFGLEDTKAEQRRDDKFKKKLKAKKRFKAPKHKGKKKGFFS